MECDYIWRGFLILKRSIGGITFDTETATLVHKFREFDRLRGEPEKFLELEDDLEELEETQALYQTNDGTFFLHLSMLEADINNLSSTSVKLVEKIRPIPLEQAQNWLESYATEEQVNRYIGNHDSENPSK